jgi:adenine-specific DNA-methyltransferase
MSVTVANLAALDTLEDRKTRGAFFTPPTIANFLARWAIHGEVGAKVLDPTCGEGVFLLAAGRELRALGAREGGLDQQVFGVDLYGDSLAQTSRLLEAEGLEAHLVTADFFNLRPPTKLAGAFGPFDAVVGNPPFVRYQNHSGEARRISAQAALRQGVRLSGLASSWASLLIHASSFVAADGRLAMVLPAELLSVGYAEPVRQWLRRRFAAVKLVFFERRQFSALENVVLLLAQGTGGCDAFSLYYVNDGEDLQGIQAFDEYAVTLSNEGKWTDLMLSIKERQVFKRVIDEHFVGLGEYGSPELGTVTGANSFFTMSEATRREYRLVQGRHVFPVCPPGSRHLRGMSFTKRDWEQLRDAGEAVWILHPSADDRSVALFRYLAVGEADGVPDAYKCQVRTPWWRPPVVPKPDLFFTYMSYRYPRLITNTAGTTFVNSMHGVRLNSAPKTKAALPILVLNSVTMLGAEVYGRSYGGGILKMEPREAARLPLPAPANLDFAWKRLRSQRANLDKELRQGNWSKVVEHVDDVLLRQTLKLSEGDVNVLRSALETLRRRRISRDPIVAVPVAVG